MRSDLLTRPGSEVPGTGGAPRTLSRGVWGEVLDWLQTEPDATGKALMARLQSEHSDRFSEAQLRTMQRRLKEWRGIMAKELVYAGTEETYTELDGLPELALVGVDSRC